MTPAGERAPGWRRRACPTSGCCAKRGAVTATALPIPMGQWFGGRRVAMAGIGGVGVAPSARGRRHGHPAHAAHAPGAARLGLPPLRALPRHPAALPARGLRAGRGPVRDARPGLTPGLQGAHPPGPAREAGGSPRAPGALPPPRLRRGRGTSIAARTCGTACSTLAARRPMASSSRAPRDWRATSSSCAAGRWTSSRSSSSRTSSSPPPRRRGGC